MVTTIINKNRDSEGNAFPRRAVEIINEQEYDSLFMM